MAGIGEGSIDLVGGTGAAGTTTTETVSPGGISETNLLNDALSQIGATVITAIDDGSINANHCLRLYPTRRRALLRLHHWNFAEARVELTQDATPPAFEFAFSYQLPADLVKMKEYNGDNPNTSAISSEWPPSTFISRYKVEGRKLLTNDGSVKIVYVRDVQNPVDMDPLFYMVLTKWLASDLAMAIIKSENKAQALMKEALAILLPLAAAVDGQEGTVMPFASDDLIWGR
jgi:hypothetical protein